ncbi:hypothetical protein H8356DRAFT_1347567 [Neocallimastix lanati (nom. inval.)]|jgi:heterogeneous nuclear rnp K-like protein 2|uniref:K Homology domain-containing protein n=1 Tax=Neocallimastix californiae TaxID=1754190 RepID=A0A1Y2BRH7_9FUNG|nr:hypothetical protein H8356DRAFT_1347567 [Neocallimastix sp. JGI-2020a]ORY37352.1 hypothetical protein LY90DRAFT_672868 [Neocallimastix californiae]|eukprot:ORY37352.1 hypothetical protein LY90DRAFT_672868 [Neocallimastix californiae]
MNPETTESTAPKETKPEATATVNTENIEDKINTEKLDLDPTLKTKIISIRSLVTSKEAGAIIGKGGKNVKEVRDATGVKAAVSPVVEGVNERILTVTGTLDTIPRAYALFAKYLIENSNLQANNNKHHNGKPHVITRTPIHLLVSHLLLGSIIGKSGENIKEIQDTSKAYIIASKDMLPQSTERVIEVIGNAESIHVATYYIIVSILRDIEKATNNILFKPAKKYNISEFLNISSHYSSQKNANATSLSDKNVMAAKLDGIVSNVSNPKADANSQPLTFKVPANFVGCTIGRKGSKIAEIRKISGTKISISPLTDENKEERTFTIIGTEENKEKALSLIYELLLEEKEKLAKKEAKEAAAAATQSQETKASN